jgi:thiosulfate/3-mercaptopyruvate sulfurtransferase
VSDAAQARAASLISSADLSARLQQRNLLVLDATVVLPAPRFDGDYRASSGEVRFRSAHIPGARFADLLQALSAHDKPYHFAFPDPYVLAEALRELGVDDSKDIVLYDGESGLWAARLWWMLRSLGIQAAILEGGFARWRREDRPIESGAVEPVCGGSLTIKVDSAAWTTRAQVEAIVRGEAPGTLINALSVELFEGRAASRYRRRGHIPGSLNWPARDLFDERGSYRDQGGLAAQAEATLGAAGRPLVIYCGGGISAAANAFVLSRLGETKVSVYDGSLEEWAADPNLPLVTHS